MINFLEKRPTAVMDTECLIDYWSIGFLDVNTDRQVVLEQFPGHPLDRARLAKIVRNWRIVSFNGIHYDLPMIALAMSGATNEELKIANDAIIPGPGLVGIRSWEFYERYGVSLPPYMDHIDLIEVAPSAARDKGMDTQFVSLKMYAAMMHSKRMADMPFGFDEVITPAKREIVRSYHGNDLNVTKDLFWELQDQLKLRAEMSVEYGVDMRSKSDAQIGEAVMKVEIERQTKKRLYRPDIVPGNIKFEAPAYIRFQTPYMQEVLATVLRAKFYVRPTGYIEMPKEIADLVITIGEQTFKMGIGGLHSQESNISHFADEDELIEDNDVTGYYPNLMINSGREPANMKGYFQPIFRRQVKERAEAKRAGKKAIAESRKIVCNGLFGKTGSGYSIVYSPTMMIQTTISGQLSILMLIEDAVLNGHRVISANTDGFVTKIRRDRYFHFRGLVFDWEERTGLNMEEVQYKSTHALSVNTYVAITTDGKAKRKGDFALSGRGQPAAMGLKKNPSNEICYDAVIAFITDGIPLERTIRECQDIRKFVHSTRVKGGGYKNGEMIGKTVRWYYCDDDPSPMLKKDGDKVARSEWAMPCMELPDELPHNINYPWYIREANAILNDIGMTGVDPSLAGRTGTTIARREEQKTYHIVELPSGIGLCGAARKSIREEWDEADGGVIPEGYRFCKKCQTAHKDQL